MTPPRAESRSPAGGADRPDHLDQTALIVVDVQRGFEDESYWGARNNLECEANIEVLLASWRGRGRPVIFVRHDSPDEASPLHPGDPGNAFKAVITGAPDLLIVKSVNSCFYGRPDLARWLQQRHLSGVAICGISTNHCCETTARMAGNLGFRTLFVLDATHTFARPAIEGTLIAADDLARVTAANLAGEFATVVATRDLTEDVASTNAR